MLINHFGVASFFFCLLFSVKKGTKLNRIVVRSATLKSMITLRMTDRLFWVLGFLNICLPIFAFICCKEIKKQ